MLCANHYIIDSEHFIVHYLKERLADVHITIACCDILLLLSDALVESLLSECSMTGQYMYYSNNNRHDAWTICPTLNPSSAVVV
jgi:hypothetical protein